MFIALKAAASCSGVVLPDALPALVYLNSSFAPPAKVLPLNAKPVLRLLAFRTAAR
jgi:hypothetical protein